MLRIIAKGWLGGVGAMSGLQVDPVVLVGDRAELIRYPADDIWLRAVGHGDIQVADYRSVDRDGPPAHSHPWDEAQIVVEGEAEFRIGDGDWIRGGSGSVQLLPSGVPHAIRVPEGSARIIQVSIGPPYDAFARDMARLQAAGAGLDEIVATALRHGVRLAT
jgi:mannose-6-phosphate isomerase-like protein (cupin superfamily)